LFELMLIQPALRTVQGEVSHVLATCTRSSLRE